MAKVPERLTPPGSERAGAPRRALHHRGKVEERREHRSDVFVHAVVHRQEEHVEVLAQERHLGALVLAQAADDVRDPRRLELQHALWRRARPDVHGLVDEVERLSAHVDGEVDIETDQGEEAFGEAVEHGPSTE
ncbi:MAG: hypothetical protein IPI43_27350 [Sandaracinaceae bacterium]|nr:hypothetical protein [Sandaracinaceae bacterium]